MKKKIILLLIIIISINLITGCWDKRELSELSIASAIGIDRVEDEYLVSVQIINPSEVTGKNLTERTEIITYEAKGKTMFEALRKLVRDTQRKVYYGQLMIVVIGEELAKKGIIEILDFFSRDHELRSDFYFIIARENKAEDILKVLTPVDKIPAEKIYNSLETQSAWGLVEVISIDKLITYMVDIGKDATISGVTLIGNKNDGSTVNNLAKTKQDTIIRVDNIAVFNDDKLVGWLNQDESRGYNAIVNNIDSSIITVPCEKEGDISVEVLRAKSTIKPKIIKGRFVIDLVHKVEGDIGDVECLINIEDKEEIEKLEKILEEQIEKYLYTSINKAKSLKSDIFGFGLAIYRKYPHEFKKINKNWDNEFANLDINIKTKVSIIGTGTTKDTFTDKIDEGEHED
ncbi:MAG: Ger(x)C family spore germination protein, partial [Senegalia sp. (in: firmicutes)]|uniref:Ger(x)C family spore germination protein n=1 Tax=Senegalia sp. (in: firmicutes) TaxID=1924098 RepID=UPI003F944B79